MKKIFLILIMCFCLIGTIACEYTESTDDNLNNENNNDDQNDDTNDEYQGRLEINFNDSNFSNYTYYDKNKNDILKYDLSKIQVLYYYELEKFVSLNGNQYYVTITDSNNNAITELSSDMELGIYTITFTHFELSVSKEIKFEVTDSKEADDNPIIDGILLPSQLDTTKETVVTFYHAMGSSSNQAVIKDIIDNFEEEMYTKYGVRVTVEQSYMGNYDTLRNTIAASIASGTQPTVAQAYPDHVSLYLQAKAISSLDKYIEHAEYGLEGDKSDSYGYIDRFFNEGNIYDKEGTTYSIPFNKSTEVLYYNIELFEKNGWSVPKTWDDVIEICEAWKETSEYKEALANGEIVAGLGIDSEPNLFSTLIQQWGGEITGFDENGNGIYLFDSPEAKSALEWLVSEFNSGNVVTATYLGTDYCSEAFIAGQIPMTIASTAGAKYNMTSDGSFTTGVAAYPQVAGATEDEKFVIQQGTNVSLFECTDKQEELFGWLFIKYLTNYESSLNWALNTGYFPIRKDVAASEEYQEYLNYVSYDYWGNPVNEYDTIKEALKVGISQADYFYVTPAFQGSALVRTEGEFIIQAILYHQQEYTIDKAIKEALEVLNSLN